MSERARPAMRTPPYPASPRAAAPLGRRALLRAGLGLSALPLLGGVGLTARAQAIKFFQIGTGTTGGTYFLVGGILANAISSPPGARPCDRGGSCGVPNLIAVAQATSGAVENINLLRERRLESALVQADIAHAAALAEGSFAKLKPFDGLRAIANLYTETIHLVVRADGPIKTPADLKGKRLGMGEEGSGTLVTARALLATYGLSEKTVKPLYLSPGAAGDRLVTGEADAFLIVGGYPLPAVADLARRLPIRLLAFDDQRAEQLLKRLPSFTPAQIEAGSYEGVPAVRSLGVGAQWVVRADVPEALVHAVTGALWNDATRKLLSEGHPRGKSIRRETALKGLAVPLHPGAERWYREAGLLGDGHQASTPMR